MVSCYGFQIHPFFCILCVCSFKGFLAFPRCSVSLYNPDSFPEEVSLCKAGFGRSTFSIAEADI